jgi:hypothetical protein
MCMDTASVLSKCTTLKQQKEVPCTVGMTIIEASPSRPTAAFPSSTLCVYVSRPKVLVASEVCRSRITTDIPQNKMTIRRLKGNVCGYS